MSSAAAPAAAGNWQQIPISDLQPSKYNPRKHFEKAGLEELAESIRAQGIVVPLVVRAMAGELFVAGTASDLRKLSVDRDGLKYELYYEIVAGERRFRAAKLAGLAAVPAIVRELSDEAARELQIIENLQREDIAPLEEAEAFQQLHELGKTDVKEIAARVGKSAEFVYGRMKLLALAAPVRKELSEGKISAGHAIEIARLPERLQRTVSQETRHREMSVSELREHIREKYHLNLESAPWQSLANAPELYPKAGACSECPRRAGNMPELAGIKPNTCTDADCFRTKAKAWIRHRQAKDSTLAAVVDPAGYWHEPPAGALRDWSDFRWIEGKACASAGKGIIVASEKPERLGKIIPICQDKKCKTHFSARASVGSTGALSEAEKRQEKKRREELARRARLFRLLVESKTTNPTPAEVRQTLAWAIKCLDHDHVKRACDALGLEPLKAKWGGNDYTAAFQKHATKLPVQALMAWVFYVAIADRDLYYGTFERGPHATELLDAAAKGRGLKLPKLQTSAKTAKASVHGKTAKKKTAA